MLINSVDRNSPAAKAGVKTQDILLEINGKPINVRFPEEIAAARKMIADSADRAEVTLKLKRGKETLDVTAQDAEARSAASARRRSSRHGA